MGFLILSDGTYFQGRSIGASQDGVGEVVFNTSLLGYQEILTDPSYLGQIISFTAPHIGNVGMNAHNYESSKPHISGAIFRNISQEVSFFLKKHRIPALTDLDTRALTLHLREKGSQLGTLVHSNDCSLRNALNISQSAKKKAQSIEQYDFLENRASIVVKSHPNLRHIVVVDCGLKSSILNCLSNFSLSITRVSPNLSFDELMSLKPDGVILSNGPGDPDAYPNLIALTQALLDQHMPLFGICLGHQIFALAAGAKIFKMKSGHHGANHPVQCVTSRRVFMSSQNHHYAVLDSCLPEALKVTYRSLLDHTIIGLQHQYRPAFSFQGHPEAHPGPHEGMFLFKQFVQSVFDATS